MEREELAVKGKMVITQQFQGLEHGGLSHGRK
jgi:hypothetical protein